MLRQGLAVAAILLIVSVSDVVAAEPPPDQGAVNDAFALLAEKCRNEAALRLSSESRRSRYSHFQFELRSYTPGSTSESQPAGRMIYEFNRNSAAWLIMSAEGVPYALCHGRGVFLCASDDEAALVHAPGLKFAFACGQAEQESMFPSMMFSTELAASSCTLNFSRLAQVLAKKTTICTFSQPNGSFRVSNERGSSAVSRFSRERSKWSFPIAGVSVRASDGAGYEITNIQAGPRIVRSILDLDQTLERNFSGSIRKAKPAKEWLDTAFPEDDAEKLQARFSIPLARQAGAAWLDAMNRATASPAEVVGEAVEKLRAGLADDTVPVEDLENLVNDLWNQVASEIDIPARDVRDANDMTIIAGLDSTAARSRLECHWGSATQLALWNVLEDAICCGRLNEGWRMRAADTLGSVGLDNAEHRLTNLRDRLQKIGNAGDAALHCMLATIAVRNAVATDEDVDTLRKAIPNKDLPLELRLYCLESAYLADAAAGLREECDALFQEGKARPDLLPRCLLAAGCSMEGRGYLIDQLKLPGREQSPRELVLLMNAILDRLQSDEPQFAEVMSVAKPYGLDPSHKPGIRYLAARIAARDRDDEEFRSRFIRAALTSNEAAFLEWALRFYIPSDNSPFQYVEDLSKAFDTANPELRQRILVAFVTHGNEPVPEEHRAAWDRLMEKAKQDQTLAVRGFGILLERSFQKKAISEREEEDAEAHP